MSKYNKSNVAPKTKLTINLAGGQAYKQSDKAAFASLLLTSFLKDQFYRTEAQTVEKIRDLLTKIDPVFAAKTAIYARREFGMRSVSHFVASEIARNVKGADWTADFLQRVIRRPDDITEILACYLSQYNKPIPNSLKRGLGRALSTLSEELLAKYKGANADLSMIDAVNILHPKHTKALGKLMKGTLKTADTWETKITQVGQNVDAEERDEAKGEAWADLVREKKLGYMALVRNLRNILTLAPEVKDEVCEQLRDKAAIKKSLMFPFRFLTAIDVVKDIDGSTKVLNALNDAIDLSIDNVPTFTGKTLVVLDSSGSMTGRPARGGATPTEIGALFAATILKANEDAELMLFADDAKYVNLSTRDSTMTIAKNIPFYSGGTNFHSIFQEASKAYDRIIILSDMQGWVGYTAPTAPFNAYKAKYKANPKIYSFDLRGYGSLQFPEKNVYLLAGFSDKVFDIMGMCEENSDALIDKIEAVSFNAE